MYDINITDSIKSLCTLLADTSLSSGKPVLIYDGLLLVPDINDINDLPIFIVDVTDPIKFNDSYSARQYDVKVGIDIWYLITNDTDEVTTDVLRKDGADLAKLLHHNKLGGLVEGLEVTSIDSSNYNAINLVAVEEQVNILSVCVSLNMLFTVDKGNLSGS